MNTYKYATLIMLSLAVFSVACTGAGLTIAAPVVETVDITFTGGDIVDWSEKTVDDSLCRVSNAIAGPAKAEFNFHRVTVDFSGDGTVEICVGYSATRNIEDMIEKKHLHSSFRKMVSGEEVMFTSPYKGQRYAWVILKMSGTVGLRKVNYKCRMTKNTLYGHLGGFFSFGGADLPYRLMYPKNYDPAKKYPLVVSVSGSGGMGNDNARSMEMITLARYLYTQYFFNNEVECFSLVPQIPNMDDIPEPYWPKGHKGVQTMFHPDWPAVNADGWFAQASIKLIKELAVNPNVSIDPERIYMTGYSYGGKACWEFLKTDPDMFAAAASGGGWPIGKAYSEPKGAFLTQLKQEVAIYKGVPVLIFAGSNDKMRLGSAAVNKEILAQGGKTRFIVYERAGHIPAAGKGWSDIENIRWLLSNKRR
ncbi:MAG: hypothetical protein K9M75_03435 [Phycisphaerae bacterium]|nr:hypothetical protein [Phycisphaerae bacterium]